MVVVQKDGEWERSGKSRCMREALTEERIPSEETDMTNKRS